MELNVAFLKAPVAFCPHFTSPGIWLSRKTLATPNTETNLTGINKEGTLWIPYPAENTVKNVSSFNRNNPGYPASIVGSLPNVLKLATREKHFRCMVILLL